MQPSASERALRRLVAELATTRSSDIEAVLDILDEAGRARVRSLLAELAGTSPEASVATEIEGLSPWLAERLALSEPTSGTGHGATVTDVTRHALRAAAAELPRVARPPPVTAAAKSGWGLWRRGGRS